MVNRYTQEEEAVIIREVKKRTDNLSKAFIAASYKIHRSPESIRRHWYGCIAPKQDNTKYTTMSDGILYRNYKIRRDDMVAKVNKNTKDNWREVQKIISKVFKEVRRVSHHR